MYYVDNEILQINFYAIFGISFAQTLYTRTYKYFSS